MNTTQTSRMTTPNSWSTAPFADAAEISSLDFSVLGEHLDLCKNPHGRLFALRCVADTTRGFIASRLVTTMMFVGLLTLLLFWVS